MKLYRASSGFFVEQDNAFYRIDVPSWDALITRDDLEPFLKSVVASSAAVDRNPLDDAKAILPPIGTQEVWAAGVTYYRSRSARIEESKTAGGGSFYDHVYSAERPELFFKATGNRVVGHLGGVAIRSDARWSVPEPELTLLISPTGKILGYTIGNDMSSRDIEGENPLYLPQAKVYNRSCALGPGILVTPDRLPAETEIALVIRRAGNVEFSGTTTLSNLKRDPALLVSYLYRDNVFPNGCFLLTGTGIVPPDSFTLNHGDEIQISIGGMGTLVNVVR